MSPGPTSAPFGRGPGGRPEGVQVQVQENDNQFFFMTKTTLEEDLARLEMIEREMIAWAAEDLDELEPGEGARIVREVVERKRAELCPARRRGGYRVPEGEAGLRWWDV